MNKITCPNCGSDNMVLTTVTVAHFVIDEDGSMGKPILDKDGVNCIDECASLSPEDVEFKCRDCNASFSAIDKDDGMGWTIGKEI